MLSDGRGIEGSLYRSDRGDTPRHLLSDRAMGKIRNRLFACTLREEALSPSVEGLAGRGPIWYHMVTMKRSVSFAAGAAVMMTAGTS